MARIFHTLTDLPYKVNVHSIVHNQGRQVDWEALADEDPPVDSLPAGTIVVEQTNGKVLPFFASGPGTHMILETGANAANESTTGYGCIVGGVIYSDLLPFSDDAGFAAALAALEGTGFVFEEYVDSRAPEVEEPEEPGP